MEKHVFKTLIKGDHKLNNKYIQGRISGISYVLCGGREGNNFAIHESIKDKSVTFTVKCTTKEYVEFRKVIEDLYPDLCKFDYIEPIC